RPIPACRSGLRLALPYPWKYRSRSLRSSRTGYRRIPSASKGSGASPGDPAQPTHAPDSTVRITDSIAVTSPPGLVTHSVAPSGRVRESTGRRLAATTSSWWGERSWTEDDDAGTGVLRVGSISRAGSARATPGSGARRGSAVAPAPTPRDYQVESVTRSSCEVPHPALSWSSDLRRWCPTGWTAEPVAPVRRPDTSAPTRPPHLR